MSELGPARMAMVRIGRRVRSVVGEAPEVQQVRALLHSGRQLYASGDERARRARFPDLEQACADAARALEAARPGSVIETSLGRVYDFTGQPELLARWEAAHARAEAAVDAARAPLPVKEGDCVLLEGHLVRVIATDLRARTAAVELRDARGVESASSWCKADALVPVSPDTPATPWPDPPEELREGFARARFRMRELSGAIERAGLVPDRFRPAGG